MLLPKYGIANYADNNTPYSTDIGTHNIRSDLEPASDISSKWIIDNNLKANPDNIIPSQWNIWNSVNSQKCSNC